MGKRWNVEKVEVKLHKVPARKRKLLLAELASLIYGHICQLHQKSQSFAIVSQPQNQGV